MTVIEKQRREEIRNFLNENSASTLQWGIDNGIITTEQAYTYTQFALWEIYSRVKAVKAIRDFMGNVPIQQMPLHSLYDLQFLSGDTWIQTETKTRTNDINTYPSVRISKDKADELDGPYYFLSTFYDGNYALFPMSGYVSTSTWSHMDRTATNGKVKVEEALNYNLEDNLWRNKK